MGLALAGARILGGIEHPTGRIRGIFMNFHGLNFKHGREILGNPV